MDRYSFNLMLFIGLTFFNRPLSSFSRTLMWLPFSTKKILSSFSLFSFLFLSFFFPFPTSFFFFFFFFSWFSQLPPNQSDLVKFCLWCSCYWVFNCFAIILNRSSDRQARTCLYIFSTSPLQLYRSSFHPFIRSSTCSSFSWIFNFFFFF